MKGTLANCRNNYKKRQYILLALFYLTFPSLLKGQYLDPFCQNIASGSKVTSTCIVDWNIGESLSTETYISKSSIMLSSGFLQNQNDIKFNIKSIDSFNLNIIIGPNPMQNIFKISCTQDGIIIQNIKITDNLGNTIQVLKGPYAGLNFQKQINLISEKNGLYYIIVNYIVGGQVLANKIFKLLKI
jgi:hypothetical protein